ncbi:FecR domain-containing protein [Candidatus Reidiella endopervernicosa]|uniref:FecR domain-containing protein n=1 Tax=Candidatus Reidiella endopervernicosa TaxID=2738883 RepID=A0A6N0HW73_9GAMM|nr:FecR domain-containing protein [Candidatus Reidiella endopervernicosa]QKQ26578.1 FecR domain-containing protein [Candidatus Reidiella endopervernicosa]
MHTLTGEMGKDNYKLKTRLANLGVRGTEFEVRLDNALLVSVHQGRVVVSNGGGSVEVPAGSSLRVTDRQGMPSRFRRSSICARGKAEGRAEVARHHPPHRLKARARECLEGAGRWRWWSDTAWNP